MLRFPDASVNKLRSGLLTLLIVKSVPTLELVQKLAAPETTFSATLANLSPLNQIPVDESWNEPPLDIVGTPLFDASS